MEPQWPSDTNASMLDVEAQRQRRVDALRQLAADDGAPVSSAATPDAALSPNETKPTGLPPAVPAMPATVPRRRRRMFIALALIVALVASIGYITLPLFHASSPHAAIPIPSALTIDLSATHLDCPTTLAWAPDGKRVAIYGSYDICDPTGGPPTTPYLAIFDTRTGKKLQTFALKDLLNSSGLSGVVTDVVWSPDGKEIAVGVTLPQQPPYIAIPVGLLLLPLDGSHPRAIIGTPPSDSMKFIFNVRTGQTAGSIANPFPAALTYRWSGDGHILPDAPFPSTTSGQSYTGRQSGGTDVSFWQTGHIQSVWPPSLDLEGPPVAQVFTTSLPQWSPDGQFLVLGLSRTGVIALRTPPDPSICVEVGLRAHCALTTLPLADAALASVLRAAQQPVPFATSDSGTFQFWDTASISWSPDGRTLATILPGNQFNDGLHVGSTFITLLSTATGQAIKQFRYSCPATTSLSNFAGCMGIAPLWSPTGQQIAFLDSGAVQLTLWKV
ncbi:MAG: hypothetical protein ACRDHP_15840 [Ktedonobacterales bacterium]